MPKPSFNSTCTSGARQFVVAGGIGDNAMLGRVVFVVIHAHHDGDVFVLGGAEIMTFFAPQ